MHIDDQTIFMICVAGAVTLGGYIVSRLLFRTDDTKLRDRLANKQAQQAGKPQRPQSSFFKELFQKIGTAAAKPFMPDNREKVSALRSKLSRAGIYTPAAIKMVTGMKVICLASGLLGGYLAGAMFDNILLGLSLGGLAGYMAPTFWLNL